MNTESYNKYKHLPLKPGHKWMCVFDSKDVRIVVDSDKEKNWAIFVRQESMSEYFENKIYSTMFSYVFCDMPESIVRPMTFEEAVKYIWDLQQKLPVLVIKGSDMGNATISTNLDKYQYENCECKYSINLGKTWHKFEVEE